MSYLLPHISNARLAQAERALSTEPLNSQSDKFETILYLAFGSNLNWHIITKQKGAIPLSKVNVMVPSLRLIFDLPGIPYLEPCFANTAFREIPKDPLPNPVNLGPSLPPIEGLRNLGWESGLIGTVYEITKEDYGKIMAKEGGGTGYKEILVPCIPLPPKVSIPEQPNPTVPRPFIARTLYQPDIPDHLPEVPDISDTLEVTKSGQPDHGLDGDTDKASEKVTPANTIQEDAESPAKSDSSKPPPKRVVGWLTRLWLRLSTPHKRPNQEYAQASARYLDLIVVGAGENELPEAYQEHLQSLQPYTITTFRQRIGWLVTIVTILPAVFLLFTVGNAMADEKGRYPGWMTPIFHCGFNSVWFAYDYIMKPLFGDGERTISAESTKEPLFFEEKVLADIHIADEKLPLLA